MNRSRSEKNSGNGFTVLNINVSGGGGLNCLTTYIFCKPAAGNEDGFLTLILGGQVLCIGKVGGPQFRKSQIREFSDLNFFRFADLPQFADHIFLRFQ